MKTSRLLGVLAAIAFSIGSASARADVAPLPTGGSSGVAGSSSASGGGSNPAGGASSTTAGTGATEEPAPKDDDGGCSITRLHHASGIALGVLGIALALGLHRARNRKQV
jgi:hypothetical protein